MFIVFFFKQKTAYEMRISDWSSDVCSSDLLTSDQRSHIGRRRVGREGIESFLREIADTGGEPVAEQGAGGEHMIGEAARVGKMLANAAARVIHEQPVQDIGSL